MTHLFFALLFLCCAYAFWAGGTPERWGAGLYALACIASFLAYRAPPLRFRSVEVGVFIVDVVVFIAFCILAVRADRYWPIWVSALLGLGVLGHLARLAGPDVIPWAYAVVLSMWSYPILLLIVLGTYAHHRRGGRSDAGPS